MVNALFIDWSISRYLSDDDMNAKVLNREKNARPPEMK